MIYPVNFEKSLGSWNKDNSLLSFFNQVKTANKGIIKKCFYYTFKQKKSIFQIKNIKIKNNIFCKNEING
ncbi:hypothetical protein BpHYR1_029679 [Brachionus plicatilis]|uniref:Uncharacterized protein n=1 Tax=Brachionus plicatilis TaxID=10195 RepID=A0A3M7SD43_BRAPC|nr:hypothetical protein BpHYR1_029679 [Brachionus plicatilis]